jgi:cold shock CspA family protein
MSDKTLNGSNKGVITYFDSSRGFGFITVPEGHSYFFHISHFERNTQPVLEGQVEFKIAPPRAVGKKPMAVRVRYWMPTALDVLAGSDAITTTSDEEVKS